MAFETKQTLWPQLLVLEVPATEVFTREAEDGNERCGSGKDRSERESKKSNKRQKGRGENRPPPPPPAGGLDFLKALMGTRTTCRPNYVIR